MPDQFILTPFFIDRPLPGLLPLARPGWILNQPTLPDGDTRQRLPALHRPLAAHVSHALRRGSRPVSIAGDCLASIAVLAGLQHAGLEPALVWFDAHGDFNTWETSPSGFLGGMPLAMLTGRGEQTLLEAARLRPIPETHVLLVGGRDLDPLERTALLGSGVTHLPEANSLPDHLPPGLPLVIHLDTDIVDPLEAPAMGYPAPGGPSAAGLRSLFHRLAQTGRVTAVSVSTWDPALDTDGRSQAVCMAMLQALLGE
jgi:arginase